MDYKSDRMFIETPRLLLRTLKPEDASQMYADWLSDPEVNLFMETKSGTLESVRAFIEENRERSDAVLFGIFLREGGKHIGTIKLEDIDMKAKVGRIGIMIGDRDQWGKGFAPEAIRGLVQWGFKELQLGRVILGLYSRNIGAFKAYTKVGFQEIGRESVQRPDGPDDVLTMEVTPKTFLA